MPRPTIEQIRGIGDVTSLFRWNLNFVAFPSVGSYPASQDLNLRCETAELPKLTITPTEINLRGHKVKQQGIGTYTNTLPITFIETIDNVIANFFREWREACWETRTGKSNTKENVEARIKINRLDNEDNEIWFYELIGCFLEDYEAGGTLDGTTSEPLKPSITISYDYFKDGSK